MRVALYIRVSTEEQAEEGYSIKAQLNRLESYAASQDWKVVKTYIDDGQSAKDMNRTELTKMLEDINDGIFDCVLVYRLDRLTRSVLDLYTMLNTFEQYNVKFKSATEVYDTTTAMGRLFITLVAALAQWERENMGERIRMGLNQKAKEGKWAINVPPVGFDRAGDFLRINEKEAEVVKEIFDTYLTGLYGMTKIAKMMNDKGYRSKAGVSWKTATIRYVLTNKIYIGTMRYNYRVNKEQYFEVENVVDPIITPEKFYEVQEMIKSRSVKHPRRATSPHIFTGVLKCVRCGGVMNSKTSSMKRNNKKYTSHHYYCNNKRYGTCDAPSIAQSYLEIQFLNKISEWNLKNEVTDYATSSLSEKNNSNIKIIKINNELVELEKRRSKWQYAWVNNMISDDDLRKRNLEEDEKEKKLREELWNLQNNIENNSKDAKLSLLLKDLQKNWSKLETHEKKKFIQLVVKEIKVNKTEQRLTPESVVIESIAFL